MSQESPRNRLQIVPKIRRDEITAGAFLAPHSAAQSNLFPTPRPGMLIFVYFPEVSEDEFRKALEFAKPSTVLELRNTPRFDIGRLNRQTVFQYFEEQHATYMDLTSWQTNPAGGSNLLDEVKKIFRKDTLRVDRPIMFLLNSYTLTEDLSQRIIDFVRDIRKSPTEVLEVPHFTHSGS